MGEGFSLSRIIIRINNNRISSINLRIRILNIILLIIKMEDNKIPNTIHQTKMETNNNILNTNHRIKTDTNRIITKTKTDINRIKIRMEIKMATEMDINTNPAPNGPPKPKTITTEDNTLNNNPTKNPLIPNTKIPTNINRPIINPEEVLNITLNNSHIRTVESNITSATGLLRAVTSSLTTIITRIWEDRKLL